MIDSSDMTDFVNVCALYPHMLMTAYKNNDRVHRKKKKH